MSDGSTVRCDTGDAFGSSTIRVYKDSDGSAIISQSYQPSGNTRAVHLHPSQVAYVLIELEKTDG